MNEAYEENYFNNLPEKRYADYMADLNSLDKLTDLQRNPLGLTRTIDFQGLLTHNSQQIEGGEDESEKYYDEEQDTGYERASGPYGDIPHINREYIDIIITKAPGISVETHPYREELSGSGQDRIDDLSPEILDSYFTELQDINDPGYKYHPSMTWYIVESPNRDLVREIHGVVVAKLQKGLSRKEALQWLAKDSPYSKMSSNKDPESSLIYTESLK